MTLLGVILVAALSTSMAVSSTTSRVPGRTGPSVDVSNVNDNRSENVNSNRSDSAADAGSRLTESTVVPPPSQTADAYVANAGSDTVSVIDTVTATVLVGSAPVGVAVAPTT